MKYTDSELVKGCRQNKAAYQKALYEQYGRRMLAVCKRYTKDQMAAEDVFQEAFVKIFQSIDSFNGGSLEGWMKQIFVRFSINNFNRVTQKKMQREVELDHEFEIGTDLPNAFETMGADEIMVLVNKLPDGCRLVFIMYVIEGYDHAEIAEIMGITVGTSKSQLFRAKALLRQSIEKLELPKIKTA